MPGYVFQYVPAYKNQKIMKKEEVIRICMNLQAGWSANFQAINNDECDFTCEKIGRLENDIWLCTTDYGCHIIQFPCCDEDEEHQFAFWLEGIMEIYELNDDCGFLLKSLGPVSNDRTYIDICFKYDNEIYVERIYTDEIDKTHYENMWDWWFGPGKEDPNPKLVFELLADKNNEGQLTTDNMVINVYPDENTDIPIAKVLEIGYRKSWIDMKAFR